MAYWVREWALKPNVEGLYPIAGSFVFSLLASLFMGSLSLHSEVDNSSAFHLFCKACTVILSTPASLTSVDEAVSRVGR